jgi:hypothetical protein
LSRMASSKKSPVSKSAKKPAPVAKAAIAKKAVKN